MKNLRLFKLSEKAKDRTLNLALVGSLLLLGGTFLPRPEVKRGEVGSTNYSVMQLEGIDTPEYPTYQPASEIPLAAKVASQSEPSQTEQTISSTQDIAGSTSTIKNNIATQNLGGSTYQRRTILGTLEKILKF